MTPLLHHLWQSTLFAAVAALLALALRKNHARARYWLWLAASLKFLVPFSILVSLGSHWSWTSAKLTAVRVSMVVEEYMVSEQLFFGRPAPAARSSHVPEILFALWLIGCISVLFFWWTRWRRVAATVRGAAPVLAGREIAALRRLGRGTIPILLCNTRLEPGVFGILRPVLLWPAGISERLADRQIEAILAHELCHVRRRDNLASAIHMLVEAVFWFHPLVWWLGQRLVDERERACDEEVLLLGNQPEVYAESILSTCKFYLESPVPCVSGVTGSDLKKRIEGIMTNRIAHQLDLGRKLLLAAAGVSAIAAPVLIGIIQAPSGHAQSTSTTPSASFEVASVKPSSAADARRVGVQMAPGGRFTASNVPLRMLMRIAYKVQDFQITGGPSWIDSDRYDITAKAEDNTSRDQYPALLQNLLAERFKLTLRHDTKEMPVFALVLAKGGPKLKESEFQGSGESRKRGFMIGRGQMRSEAAQMSQLAGALSQMVGRTVIDKTGLTKYYEYTLEWTPEGNEGMGPKGMARDAGGPGPGPEPPPQHESNGPSLFTALQEQLGLKLESTKGPVEILFIEHAEKPAEN